MESLKLKIGCPRDFEFSTSDALGNSAFSAASLKHFHYEAYRSSFDHLLLALSAFPSLQTLEYLCPLAGLLEVENWTGLHQKVACKNLKSLTLDMKNLTFNDQAIPIMDDLRHFFGCFTNLKRIRLNVRLNSREEMDRFFSMLHEGSQLDHITIKNLEIIQFDLDDFAQYMPSLKYLAVIPLRLTPESVANLLENAPNLRVLVLSHHHAFSDQEIASQFAGHRQKNPDFLIMTAENLSRRP